MSEKMETADELIARINKNALKAKTIAKKSEAKPNDMHSFGVKYDDMPKPSSWIVLHEKCLAKATKHLAKLNPKYSLVREGLLTVPGAKCNSCNALNNESAYKKALEDAKQKRTRRALAYAQFVREQILLGNM